MATRIESRLAALGWTQDREIAFAPQAEAGLFAARVVGAARDAIRARATTQDYSVIVQRGFRRSALAGGDYPVVGDWLALEPVDHDRAALREVLPRTSRFARGDQFARRTLDGAQEQVIATNVDTVVIVAALAHDLNLRRLERYLTLAWSSGAAPVVLLNKADLCDDLPARIAEVRSVAGDAPVLTSSALFGAGLDGLAPWLQPGQTMVLLGSSGVGKSTITNALLRDDRQSVQDVREGDSRGRHTTTARELFELPGGGLLIDTPGMRSLELSEADEGLDLAFADIEALAAECRFRDCAHDSEPGCAVRAAIEAGDLPEDRLRARRALRKELGIVAQASTVAARRANARSWGKISREASDAAARKRGER
jgi:ribosome biogenesis GTPase